jgi:hypothetical protein
MTITDTNTGGDGWQSEETGSDSPPEQLSRPTPGDMPRTRPADREPEPAGDLPPDSLELPENLAAARKLRSEARNARDRAKAAEGEVERLNTILNEMRRAEIGRLAEQELRDQRDLFDRHSDISEFIDDDGNINTEAVITAAKSIIEDRPHFGRDKTPIAPPSQRPVEALRSGAVPEPQVEPSTWASALKRIAT